MERIGKEELLGRIRANRGRFDAIVAAMPEQRLTEPLLPGGWSVKDVLAHIAWGEREAIGVAEARALVGSPLWDVSEDERNRAVVDESRSRPLEEVLADYRSTFERYISALETLSEDDLNEADRFVGLVETIPGWRPWRVLYDPGHYDEHGATIEEHVA